MPGHIRSIVIVGLLLAVALTGSARVDAQVPFGVGKTYGEALVNAQINGALMDAAAQAGRDLSGLRNLNIELAQRIAFARSAYWQAIYAGKDVTTLEANYLTALWQKDLYFFLIHATNLASEAQGGGRGLGSLINMLTFTDLDGGIPGFARHEFESWATEAYRLYATGGLDAGLSATHPSYVIYNKRRNLAEFIFENPFSPLRSTDPQEYYAGWLLATDNVRSIAEGYAESAAARRIVGTEPFDRVVADLRRNRLGRWEEDFSRARLRSRQGRPVLRLEVADWQMTRHDPDKYALYLIKRWTGRSWEEAEALHGARVRRLGRDVVANAVREAYAQADDPNGKIVADPYQQQRQTGLLLDPIAERFGQFTIWEDALDVAVARMDRTRMRQAMLDYLAGAPGGGTPAERYARIISAVDETLLLAAFHHKQAMGLLPLIGYHEDTNSARPLAFAEELRILEGFAAARDDRTYAVRELLGVDQGPLPTPIERAVASFQQRVATHGEAAVLKAARTTRMSATMTHKGIEQNGDAFRRLLGEGANVVNERAREQRKGNLERTVRMLAGAYTGLLANAVLAHYVNQELAAIQANADASRGSNALLQRSQASDIARSKLVAAAERATSTLQRAAAAYERFESSGVDADKREAETARKALTDELRFAYDLLLATDKTEAGEIARRYGFASVLDQHLKSSGDVLKAVNDVLTLYGATN
jgi:hypothetical protein